LGGFRERKNGGCPRPEAAPRPTGCPSAVERAPVAALGADGGVAGGGEVGPPGGAQQPGEGPQARDGAGKGGPGFGRIARSRAVIPQDVILGGKCDFCGENAAQPTSVEMLASEHHPAKSGSKIF